MVYLHFKGSDHVDGLLVETWMGLQAARLKAFSFACMDLNREAGNRRDYEACRKLPNTCSRTASLGVGPSELVILRQIVRRIQRLRDHDLSTARTCDICGSRQRMQAGSPRRHTATIRDCRENVSSNHDYLFFT